MTNSNTTELKSRKTYHLMLISLGIALLLFFLRLLPLCICAMLVAKAAGCRLLYLRFAEPKGENILPAPVKDEQEPTPTELELEAFGLIQQRVTELVTDQYPEARWLWEHPNARAAVFNGEDTFIILNRAGGFRRAQVIIHNLIVQEVRFCTADTDTEKDDTPDEDTVDEEELPPAPPQNFELMAFEWVENNTTLLNSLCNEAIAQKKDTAMLTADQLPVKECWADICNELKRTENIDSVLLEDGILLRLKN